jgi:hypothetical protein
VSALLAARLLPLHDGISGAVIITFECGTTEAVKYLNFAGGEAVTFPLENNKAHIFFQEVDPSLSAVFEELGHALQHRQRSYVGEDVRLMRCLREVEVKQCLVDYKHLLWIPEPEDEGTRMQLESERMNLQTLRELFA